MVEVMLGLCIVLMAVVLFWDYNRQAGLWRLQQEKDANMLACINELLILAKKES